MTKILQEALQMVRDRTTKGSSLFYKPLPSRHSVTIRQYYKDQIDLPVRDTIFQNKSGTVIANGFSRLVVGDYGAYFEFSTQQIVHNNIEDKWPGAPKYPVKYIWMESKDWSRTKVYFQKRTVRYADYKPGFYYIAPEELVYQEKT